MKNYSHYTLVGKIFILLLIVLLPFTIHADDDIDELKKDKEKYELEAAIEKAKKEIAEAEKNTLLAKIPSTSTEALTGSVEGKFGTAGLVIAFDLAKEIGTELCETIKTLKSTAPSKENTEPTTELATNDGIEVLIYEKEIVSGIVSAQIFERQIGIIQHSLTQALGEEMKLTEEGLLYAPFVASEAIKGLADLVSMFKTNISVSSSDFVNAKSFVLTAMAETCRDELINLGFGYSGELDLKSYVELKEKLDRIMADHARLNQLIAEKKELKKQEKDESKKERIQSEIVKLSFVAKHVNDFISAIKPESFDDNSPLPMAAKFIALSRQLESGKSKILDINIKLDGLSIIKENIFTGQKLSLSGVALGTYRFYNLDGSIFKTGVFRKFAEPVQIDLRGKDSDDAFWNKYNLSESN